MQNCGCGAGAEGGVDRQGWLRQGWLVDRAAAGRGEVHRTCRHHSATAGVGQLEQSQPIQLQQRHRTVAKKRSSQHAHLSRIHSMVSQWKQSQPMVALMAAKGDASSSSCCCRDCCDCCCSCCCWPSACCCSCCEAPPPLPAGLPAAAPAAAAAGLPAFCPAASPLSLACSLRSCTPCDS